MRAAAAYSAAANYASVQATCTMDLMIFYAWYLFLQISDAMAVGSSVQCAPGPFPAGVGGAVTRYNGTVHGSNRGFAPKRSQ